MSDDLFGRSPAARRRTGDGAAKFGLGEKPERHTRPLSLVGVNEDGMQTEAPPQPPERPDAAQRPEPAPKTPAAAKTKPKNAVGARWAHASVQPATRTAVRQLANRRGIRLADVVVLAVDEYQPPKPAAAKPSGGLPLSGPKKTPTTVLDQYRIRPEQSEWLDAKIAETGLKMTHLVGGALDAYVEAHADELQ